MNEEQIIHKLTTTFNINGIYAHYVFKLVDKTRLLEDAASIA